MKQTIGERIAEKRKGKGLTQEEVAEKLGVSAQAVSKWENDLSCPDIMALPVLAEYLCCSVDYLLTGKDESFTVMMMPQESRKDFNKLMLRFCVTSVENTKVKINLPLPLIKVILESGASFSTFDIDGKGKLDNPNIDWNAIVSLAEQGIIGKLMEIESADGGTVEVFVE